MSMPFKLAASENPVTILPLAGHTQSTLSSPSAGAGAGFGSTRATTGGGSAGGAGDRRGCGLRRRDGAGRAALDLAQRLLGVRLLDRLGLRLVGLGVARARASALRAALRGGARRGAPPRRRRPPRLPAAPYGAAPFARPRRRRRRFGRRRHPQHLTDADQVDVLDVVPRGELAIVEAVVERDRMQRVAALHRVGRRPPIRFRPVSAARSAQRRRRFRDHRRRRRTRRPVFDRRRLPALRTPRRSSTQRDSRKRASRPPRERFQARNIRAASMANVRRVPAAAAQILPHRRCAPGDRPA